MAGTAMDRVLGVASICVGLLATIVLAVAVSVDYWLHTDEPIDTGMTDPPHSDQNDDTPASHVAMVTTNSGLFRVCVYAKADYTDEDYEELMTDHTQCGFISYFGQSYERFDSGVTSESILRDIRKATPVIIFSLVLMLSADIVSIVGYVRKDYRTIVGAILSIVSALGLALGHIFYISAVNDEVSQWKSPDNATEDQVFSYRYGWAFYAAGSAFIFLMIAAVGNITVYVRRFYVRNDVRRILTVVPGLEAKMTDDDNDHADDVIGDQMVQTTRPTVSTSNDI